MVDMNKTPYYIMHGDPGTDDAPTYTVEPTADGVNINGEEFYSKTKVDSLLATQESTLKAWATSQFEPKTA